MKNIRDFQFELKELYASGTFTGYGSVFHIRDAQNEIVAPGAFTESLNAHKAAGKLPAMLWMHRLDEPCGIYTSMVEDAKGLKVSGQLALKTSRGAEAFEFLKLGAVSGLSIGFRTREDGRDKSGARILKKVDLHEVSLVAIPANDSARVEAVKSIANIRSAEDILRDAGFSRNEAATFISRVKALNQRDADTAEQMKAIFVALKQRNVFA